MRFEPAQALLEFGQQNAVAARSKPAAVVDMIFFKTGGSRPSPSRGGAQFGVQRSQPHGVA
ncbi:MAG: hypothetical protein CTY30_09005 [Methylocystis sp.]|nr:MAG: hypothetical protein CTY30_09005 [Methylocystis sp.]